MGFSKVELWGTQRQFSTSIETGLLSLAGKGADQACRLWSERSPECQHGD